LGSFLPASFSRVSERERRTARKKQRLAILSRAG